ncbi:MAG: hypothetical protein RL757_2459 [Bacteroidota bacterium]|jgi:hypothetical protein
MNQRHVENGGGFSPFTTNLVTQEGAFESHLDDRAEQLHQHFTKVESRHALSANQPSWLADGSVGSPFHTNVNAKMSKKGRIQPRHVEAYRILRELHDEEFDAAVYELGGTAYELMQSQFTYEFADARQATYQAEALLTEHFMPLRREMELTIDQLAKEFSTEPNRSEGEIEQFFLQLEAMPMRTAPPSMAVPFDNFLKKFRQKAQTFIKNAAKKIGKVLPIGKLLAMLKKMVVPIIRRVIQFAMNRLPASVRPFAMQLANKLLGKPLNIPTQNADDTGGYAEDSTESGYGDEGAAASDAGSEENGDWANMGQAEPTAGGDPAEIQNSFDAQLTEMLLLENETDLAASVQNFVSLDMEMTQQSRPEDQLVAARQRLVTDLQNLKEGESPTAAIQNFIPVVMAIMPAVRTLVKIIGREKVVNSLSGLIGKAIGRFVQPEGAAALSKALADQGLRLLKLETSDGQPSQLAYETIARTVEDTIKKVATMPENLTDGELFEAYVELSFESSVVPYFPDQLLKNELRELPSSPGQWNVIADSRRKPVYEKYSQMPEIVLDEQKARALVTFGGSSIYDFLTRQRGATLATPLRVKVHIFRAVPDTWLSKISRDERNTPGLGSATEAAWSQIHLLDTVSAGVLFGYPDFGFSKKQTTPHSRNRHLIYPNERFFYLEVLGNVAPPPPPPPPPGPINPIAQPNPIVVPTRQLVDVQLVLDFTRNEVRFHIFYPPQEAAHLARFIAEQRWVAFVRYNFHLVKKYFDLSQAGRTVRIDNELTENEFKDWLNRTFNKVKTLAQKADANIKRELDNVIDFLENPKIANFIKAFKLAANQFIDRQREKPDEGITVTFKVTNVPYMNQIHTILDVFDIYKPTEPTDYPTPGAPVGSTIVRSGKQFER